MLEKQILIETLRFYLYKLDNNLCTMEEMESAAKVVQENMDIRGTIKDFARFYNVSEGNVRATINRKLIDKPSRNVLYPFNRFSEVVPNKWRNDAEDKDIHKT